MTIARAHDIVALRAQLVGHPVEGLAELGQIAFGAQHRHLDVEIAGRHDVGGPDQAPDRRHQPVGEVQAEPRRRQQHRERDHRVHQREGKLDAEPPRLQIGEIADGGLGFAQMRDDPRIERTNDAQIGIVVAAHLDDGGDRIGVEQHADLRLGFVDGRETGGVRQRSRLLRLDIGALDDRGVGPDDHRSRQSAHSRLRGEELLEALAFGIEQRLGARHVERHRHDVAADHLRVFLQIGVGDDQRVLDDGAGSRGEQPVEAAVERDARHHRHQDCGHRRDHGEQADDLDVQPRRGAAAPAGLHHQPHLVGDDADQQEHGQRVDQKKRDDDRMRGRDRRQIGQHDEGCEGRQHRKHRGERTQHAHGAARRGRGDFGGRRLLHAGDAGH